MKLKYDAPLSNFAFNCNLRHYNLELVRAAGAGNVDITVGSALDCFGGVLPYDEVGRCRSTPGFRS